MVLGLSRVRFPGKQVLGWRLVCRAFTGESDWSHPLRRWGQDSGIGQREQVNSDAVPVKASVHSMGCSGTWRGPSVLSQVGARSPELYMGCWLVVDMGCHWKECDLEWGDTLHSSEGLAAKDSLPEAFPTAAGDEAFFLSGEFVGWFCAPTSAQGLRAKLSQSFQGWSREVRKEAMLLISQEPCASLCPILLPLWPQAFFFFLTTCFLVCALCLRSTVATSSEPAWV